MAPGKSGLHVRGEGVRVISIEPWKQIRASRHVEVGLSRSFSHCGRKPWVPSTCAGDLMDPPYPQHLLEAATGRGGPHSRAGLHVPGWGGTSALTSSSQPRGWTELDRVKGALSPSSGRTALRFPRSAFVGGLWPLPAQPLARCYRPRGPRPSLGESSCAPRARFLRSPAACTAGHCDLQ